MWLTKVKIAAVILLSLLAAGVRVSLLPGAVPADSAPAASAGERTDPPKPGKDVPKLSPQAEGNREVEAKLAATLNVDFQATTLGEALTYFADKAGVNVVLSRAAKDFMLTEGIDLDDPISLRLKRVPGRLALRFALEELGLAYHVEEGVVVVTPGKEGKRPARLQLRFYPVGDLVGAGGKADNLIEVLTKSIAPSTWSEQGGSGTIAYFTEGRTLIVTQTAVVQDQIEALLTKLIDLAKKTKQEKQPRGA
jgi:hypothetical protein